MSQILNKSIGPKNILNTVSNIYNIKVNDILSKKKYKEIFRVRLVLVYIMREQLGMSFPGIGRILGGRDHTTIIHSYDKAKKLIKKDNRFKNELEIVIGRLFLGMKKNDFAEVKNIFNKRNKSEEEKNKKYLIAKSLDDFPKKDISPEISKRWFEILKKYKNGLTLEEIGKEFNLSRQRINQIIEKGFIYEARDLVKSGIMLDVKEFLKQKKREHLIARNNRRTKQNKKNNKEKRWSKYYDSCRKCNTVIIPHHSHGYCKKCYPKTKIFKEIQEASRLRNIESRKKYVSEYSKKYSKRQNIIHKKKKSLEKDIVS